MPAIFGAGNQALAQVRSLAARGDVMATALMALMNNTYYLAMTAAAEAGNVIKVTGQVTDQDGNAVAGIKDILFTSKPVAGTGNLSDGGNGTVVAGAASTSLWMRTDANGNIQVDVANVNAELNLLVAHLDNGTTELLPLTFA
mgnify:CR=1 FL=1